MFVLPGVRDGGGTPSGGGGGGAGRWRLEGWRARRRRSIFAVPNPGRVQAIGSPGGGDRLTRSAGIRSFELGDHRVTYLPDGGATVRPRGWLPESTGRLWSEYAELLNMSGDLTASVGGLLLEYDGRSLLIDAGFGPLGLSTPWGMVRGGKLVRSLAAVGKKPTDIDLVALTHLHPERIGWLWQPHPDHPDGPFAHAEVLVGQDEWAHAQLAAAHGTTGGMLDRFAGRVRTVRDGETIFPDVQVMAAPGHTRGHVAYVLRSHGYRMIAFGAALQSPIQIGHPELTGAADDEPGASVATVRRLIEELQTPYTLGFGADFADVQFGRVTTGAPHAAWIPI